MELLLRICLFLTGMLNLLPAVLAFAPHKIRSSYGIDLPDANYELLLRHRAVLFGIVGGIMLVAAIARKGYFTAVLIGLTSMVSFIVLYYVVDGSINSELTKIMQIDIVGVLILVVGYGLFRFK